MELNVKNILNTIHCAYHRDAQLIEDHHTGDMICSHCGLIVGDRFIDPTREWRTFTDERSRVDPCRTGSAPDPLVQDCDLSTIMQGNNSAHGGVRSFSKDNATNRKLIAGFGDIVTMAERINACKSTVDLAKHIFKQVHDTPDLRHRPNDAKATACLYIACRQEGVPRTFKELCAVSTVCKRVIGHCFKLILKQLNTSLELLTSENFMSRFCTNLNLPLPLQKAATHIAQRAIGMSLVDGRSPISVAAAAIYMTSQASPNALTPREIEQIAGVAEVTIRQSYELMHPHAAELFPNDFIFFRHINLLPAP
uniref:Transcription initiation factor IIB n=1 Tax=Anopheles farauti TaxID=69004 RepID=A0A182QR36_9DIPT